MTSADPLDGLREAVAWAENRLAQQAAAGAKNTTGVESAPRFRPAERPPVPTGGSGGTEYEIAMLRSLIHRLYEYTFEVEMDLRDLCNALAALGAGATRLSVLLLSRYQAASSEEDIAESGITQGVSEVIKEIGLK